MLVVPRVRRAHRFQIDHSAFVRVCGMAGSHLQLLQQWQRRQRSQRQCRYRDKENKSQTGDGEVSQRPDATGPFQRSVEEDVVVVIVVVVDVVLATAATKSKGQ